MECGSYQSLEGFPQVRFLPGQLPDEYAFKNNFLSRIWRILFFRPYLLSVVSSCSFSEALVAFPWMNIRKVGDTSLLRPMCFPFSFSKTSFCNVGVPFRWTYFLKSSEFYTFCTDVNFLTFVSIVFNVFCSSTCYYLESYGNNFVLNFKYRSVLILYSYFCCT